MGMFVVRNAIAAGCLAALAATVQAFQLAPVGTRHEVQDSNVSTSRIEREAKRLQRAGVDLFVRPVHETLTQIIFSCDDDWARCANADLELAGPYVMAGVRWNDDPGFMLREGEGSGISCKTEDSITFMRQTVCWISLFEEAKKRALRSPKDFQGPGRKSNLMTRSHFGDLQFLHAMAMEDRIPAEQTKAKLMMWSRFAWGVVSGEYTLATDLGAIPIDGWAEHFVSGPNVQDLLTLGRSSVRPHVKDVAFGTLLHLIQDSVSASHVTRREPVDGTRCGPGEAHRPLGRIVTFGAYAGQDHGVHGRHDAEERARVHRQMDPDVVDVGRTLRDMVRRQAGWSEVGPYLSECVFALDPAATVSGPGIATR